MHNSDSLLDASTGADMHCQQSEWSADYELRRSARHVQLLGTKYLVANHREPALGENRG